MNAFARPSKQIFRFSCCKLLLLFAPLAFLVVLSVLVNPEAWRTARRTNLVAVDQMTRLWRCPWRKGRRLDDAVLKMNILIEGLGNGDWGDFGASGDVAGRHDFGPAR